MSGAEDRLEKSLKVVRKHYGGKSTNAEVVEAVHTIQQRTRRNSGSQDVCKFQDVSIE